MAKRVVILGGGIGGLSAAHELVERGFAVHVFEGKPVPGGKARTITVPHTGSGGRPDLPGEHGFRFFPGFYRHLTDTMRRIPRTDGPGVVFDRLQQASDYLLSSGPEKELRLLVRFPRSLDEWQKLFASIGSAKALGIPEEELLFFAGRMLIILTSCDERRLAELEKVSWWDFIAAEGKSEAYKLYLAVGLTRTLVALRAQEASARTIGTILIQLLLEAYSPWQKLDRLLDGPTSEVWIDPWMAHLRKKGVQFHFGAKVVALEMRAGRIEHVVVETGTTRSHHGTADDSFVAALPVEQFAPLITPALSAAEPALGRLGELRVAWMNGIQFYLKRDYPLVSGHANFVASPSALTAVSQNQFWSRPLSAYGDGSAGGCFSVDISNWDNPGIVYGKPLNHLGTREEVKREVQAQLQAALPPEERSFLDDENLAAWFLDADIEFPNPAHAVNLEPLLINTANSWQNRPEATTRIPNLFLSADYVRTNTDLATMEGANEAARRAVNGILAATGVAAAPCELWRLEEPALFWPARAYDRLRFALGLPHVGLRELPEPGPKPASQTVVVRTLQSGRASRRAATSQA